MLIVDCSQLNVSLIKTLYGENDLCLKYLEQRYVVTISTLPSGIKITGGDGESEALVADVIACCIDKLSRGESYRPKDLRFIADAVEGGDKDIVSKLEQVVMINSRGKQIKPKTIGQAKYIESINSHSIVLGVGPAGTGKTYLAVALAVKALKNKEVERIILTRPAVEAGEKLGFLPGDLGAKVDPYLRPLFDALQEMFGLETYSKLLERGSIEIAPLAYMRGRTLSNAFIILDEAQNTTREQMKMFLTRMGEGSKIVVTGDITQIDLPRATVSGLVDAIKILGKVDGIEIIKLSGKDVVRHEMVMKIVEAYQKFENGAINERREERDIIV